jgi:hypothetical protein
MKVIVGRRMGFEWFTPYREYGTRQFICHVAGLSHSLSNNATNSIKEEQNEDIYDLAG